jgi:hypothetical protein
MDTNGSLVSSPSCSFFWFQSFASILLPCPYQTRTFLLYTLLSLCSRASLFPYLSWLRLHVSITRPNERGMCCCCIELFDAVQTTRAAIHNILVHDCATHKEGQMEKLQATGIGPFDRQNSTPATRDSSNEKVCLGLLVGQLEPLWSRSTPRPFVGKRRRSHLPRLHRLFPHATIAPNFVLHPCQYARDAGGRRRGARSRIWPVLLCVLAGRSSRPRSTRGDRRGGCGGGPGWRGSIARPTGASHRLRLQERAARLERCHSSLTWAVPRPTVGAWEGVGVGRGAGEQQRLHAARSGPRKVGRRSDD